LIIKSILDVESNSQESVDKKKIDINTNYDNFMDNTHYPVIGSLTELVNTEIEQKSDITDVNNKDNVVKLRIFSVIKSIFNEIGKKKVDSLSKKANLQIENSALELIQKVSTMSYIEVKDKSSKTFNNSVFGKVFNMLYLAGGVLSLSDESGGKEKIEKILNKICECDNNHNRSRIIYGWR